MSEYITVQNNDIEGCHRLGKATPQNTTVRFVKRKYRYEALEKKADLKNVNNRDLGFESNTKLFLSENLTPLNQQLAWMCRELKQVCKIHSCWSSKGVVTLRRTMDDESMSVINKTQIRNIYPDFILIEKSSRK